MLPKKLGVGCSSNGFSPSFNLGNDHIELYMTKRIGGEEMKSKGEGLFQVSIS